MYETAGVFIGHLLFYYYIKMKQVGIQMLIRTRNMMYIRRFKMLV